MPGFGGSELLQRLATTRPGLRVLYLAGVMDDVIAQHGLPIPAPCFSRSPSAPGRWPPGCARCSTPPETPRERVDWVFSLRERLTADPADNPGIHADADRPEKSHPTSVGGVFPGPGPPPSRARQVFALLHRPGTRDFAA